MKQGMSRRDPRTRTPARDIDQFYTRPDVAALCVSRALEAIGPLPGMVLHVEPAAGEGAFLDTLPEPRLGLDISPPPHRPDILRCDFLGWSPPPADRVVVITNVPFGRNASLAAAFLNHAAGFASHVASILPRSFEKASVRARLSPGLHLIHQSRLSPDSFVHAGKPRSVPVVFQVYEVRPEARPRKVCETGHPDFEFVRDPGAADFAFQRVGARAGRVSDEGLRMSPQSHHFIRSRTLDRDVRGILSRIDWDDVKHRTAGNPSIGKADIVAAYKLEIR